MQSFYCTDTQDRIPPEFFAAGKAVFCGGKPYLKISADRLGLKPDAAPPPHYAALLAVAPAVPKTPDPISKPASPKPLTQVQLSPNASTIVGSIMPMATGANVIPASPAPSESGRVPSTIVSTAKVQDLVQKLKSVRSELGKEKDVVDLSNAGSAPIKQALTPPATKEPVPVPSAPAPAKIDAVAAAAIPKPQPTSPASVEKKDVPVAVAKPAVPAAVMPGASTEAKVAEAPNPGAVVAVQPPKPVPLPAKKEPPRILAEAHLDRGEPLSAEELLKIPIFEGIAANQLERLPGAVVLRKFKKGEIICREGEYGSTAFYILTGKAEVFLNAPIMQVKSTKKENARQGLFGVFRKFTHGLSGRREDPSGGAIDRYIPIDGPSDLPYENPIATMVPQDLFGEMTCMSFYPRSATVRALEDCTMLEMLRNVLQVLQKNKKFKEQLEKAYRERALGQHLRSVPTLSGLDEKFIDQLRNRVALVDFDPGDVIIKQGDPADAFYLIRMGCVKVSQNHPGGDMVLTYLGRGEYFGEMGLLKGGKRTASCTALDHVEVVKIKKADFDFMLSWYEDLRPKFEAEAERREKASRLMTERAPTIHLDDFLGQGLMHAQSLLLLDLEKCTRCDECVRACADSHDGVTRLIREGLRFDKYLVPTTCRSCMDPVCMIGCPVGSIRRKESLEIIIEDWCIGCGICAKQCPYGNISMHPFEVASKPGDAVKPEGQKAEIKEKAVTCDLCTELKEPSCVYACPHDAAHRVDAREFFMQQAQKSN